MQQQVIMRDAVARQQHVNGAAHGVAPGTQGAVVLGGLSNALNAAEHYRALRSRGYTVRSPIDVLLASYCIAHGHLLLHRDADFDVLETLRGLKVFE